MSASEREEQQEAQQQAPELLTADLQVCQKSPRLMMKEAYAAPKRALLVSHTNTLALTDASARRCDALPLLLLLPLLNRYCYSYSCERSRRYGRMAAGESGLIASLLM